MATRRSPGKLLVRARAVAQKIHEIRGERVMLDEDLALLYGVTTKALNQAVRRNRTRFPADFMFQLSREEAEHLRSQNVTSNRGRGGRRYAPLAFTEQGVAMLSSVVRSARAIQVNIEIMRTFVQLRAFFASNDDLARRIDRLETKYDARFKLIFDAIRQLIAVPARESRRRIGFSAP
ncbi:MAG: ORF6N domain-containing protein [Gemmatimonadaceae bacterium]